MNRRSGPPLLAAARARFHRALLDGGVLALVLRKVKDKPWVGASNADAGNAPSTEIGGRILTAITGGRPGEPRRPLKAQALGSRFEKATREFLEATFRAHLGHLRPGHWEFNPPERSIQRFEPYRHLMEIAALARASPELEALLGTDYLIAPDIVITRAPEPDEEINSREHLVDDTVATRSALRRTISGQSLILHASISCKWTLRTDRAQNARLEALNLIRNRKGRLPHIAVVTAEPLPSRLASLALGTGDIDCVYHFALPELAAAVKGSGDTENVVRIMVEGKRLKDISDLPLDLAI